MNKLTKQLETLQKAYKLYKEQPDLQSFGIYDDAAKILFAMMNNVISSGGIIRIVFEGGNVSINKTGWLIAENISRARWLDINRKYGGYEMTCVKEIK